MIPDVIRIEPSSACNLRCIHCSTSKVKMERGIMSDDTFEYILSNLKEIPRVVVLYHGGEPFLNKNLLNWVSKLKHMGVQKIKIVTNGMLIKDSIPEIVNSGLDCLSISIDGTTLEESNSIRIGCDTLKVIDNVKNLIMIKNGRHSDKPEITISNVQFVKNPSVPDYLINIFGAQVKYFSYPVISWAGQNSYDPPQNIKGRCPLLEETITIRWNGDVVPCCYDITSEYVMGNIFTASLKEIRNGKLFTALRNGIHSNKPVRICEPCCL